MTYIKICGITTCDQAKKIASMDIHAIGIIAVKGSPRYVSEEKRREIFNEITKKNPKIKRVLVVMDLKQTEIESTFQGSGSPSVIQLHGNESKDYCKEIRNRNPHIEWWKAIRVKEKKDLDLAKAYEKFVDKLLIDSWSKKSYGGTGYRIPLEWIKETNFTNPWWIAGGISSEWIPKVLKNCCPFGIDASSLLEKKPGIKDIKKVEELIEEVKKQDRQLFRMSR